MTSGNLVIVEDEEILQISGDKAGFLYISSEPLKEPVARYGPFIMNTMDEILQAIDDFNDGTFDK